MQDFASMLTPVTPEEAEGMDHLLLESPPHEYPGMATPDLETLYEGGFEDEDVDILPGIEPSALDFDSDEEMDPLTEASRVAQLQVLADSYGESTIASAFHADELRRREFLSGNMPAKKRSGSRKGGRKRPATKRKSRVSAKGSSNLLGYLNPFAGTEPVIPDGSVSASLPTMHKNVQTVEIPAGEIAHIIMYPGLNAGIIYASQSGLGAIVANEVGAIDDETGHVVYNQQLAYPNPRINWAGDEETNGVAFVDGNISSGGDLVKWRLVSQGLRLALLNTDEQNDGWWESCRMTRQRDQNEFGIRLPTGSGNITKSGTGNVDTLLVGGEGLYVAPTHHIFSPFSSSSSLAEFGGYSAAPLKMIGGAMWQLKPYQASHEFSEIHANWRLDAGAGASMSSPSKHGATITTGMFTAGALTQPAQLTLQAGTSEGRDLVDSFVDLNHDLVYIRIHGGTSVTKLLLTHVANHECVYKTDSVLHKFMRPHRKDQTFDKHKDKKNPTPTATA